MAAASESVFEFWWQLEALIGDLRELEGGLASVEAAAVAAPTREQTAEFRGRLAGLEAAATATAEGIGELWAPGAEAPATSPWRPVARYDLRELEEIVRSLAAEVALLAKGAGEQGLPSKEALMRRLGGVEGKQTALRGACRPQRCCRRRRGRSALVDVGGAVHEQAAAAQPEEDDSDREAAAATEASRRASEAHVRKHLANHLRRNPGATYKSWIADFVPENVSLDPRLENEGSAWLEIWRDLSSRSRTQADEPPWPRGAGEPPRKPQPMSGRRGREPVRQGRGLLQLRCGLMPIRYL